MSDAIENRHDFVYFFDVFDGNPNGDPDAGNLPRVDPETGHGLVTDVCLKRKVRNYVQLAGAGVPGTDIFIKEKAVLNTVIANAHLAVEDRSKGRPRNIENARQFMCRKYYDVRTFGAVMSTGKNAGQVRGPVQLTFARSVAPVVLAEHTITRVAVTTEVGAEKQEGLNRSMGHKYTIPYALYRCHGFISASLASQTGFGAEDLELFWQALIQMFECDRSAARGQMSARKLIVFKHDSALGNAPAHKLFDMVRLQPVNHPVRTFSDYEITVPTQGSMPPGISVIEKI